MTLRRAFLPIAAVALAAFAAAQPAAAHPLDQAVRPLEQASRGGASVHAGVVVPIGPAHRPPGPVAVPGHRHGHYEIRVERYWIPEEIVAYDAFGHPVVRPGYWAEREVRVWVPHPPRHRVIHRRAPRGYVAVGIHTR